MRTIVHIMMFGGYEVAGPLVVDDSPDERCTGAELRRFEKNAALALMFHLSKDRNPEIFQSLRRVLGLKRSECTLSLFEIIDPPEDDIGI